MTKLPTCARKDGIPVYRLALEKDRCLRSSVLPIIDTTDDVMQFFSRHWGCKPQEFFLALYLDSRNQIIGVQEVAIGGAASTGVDPKVLFAGALAAGAISIIVCHNHPSGDPTPSLADLQLTKQLVEGGKLLSIRILDHIVVARGGGFSSMSSRGEMPK